jgi:hypothetical protein
MPTINRSALSNNLRGAENSLAKAEEKMGEAAGELAASAVRTGAKLVVPGVAFAGSAWVGSKTLPATVDAAMGKDVAGFIPHLSTSDRILATGVYGLATAAAAFGIAKSTAAAVRIIAEGSKKTEAASSAD